MPESDQRVSVSPSGDDAETRRTASNRLALGFRESRRRARWVSLIRSFAACHRGDKEPRYVASGLGARAPL